MENLVKRTIQMGTKSTLKDTLLVAYGVDKNYWRQMLVSMASILRHNDSICFSVVVDSFDSEMESLLHKFVEKHPCFVSIYEINDEFFRNWPIYHQKLSMAAFYRIALFSLVTDCSKVLYLDADVICLKSLIGLRTYSMGDTVALVVPDLKRMITYGNKIGLPQDHIYFNSGVMLVNLSAWQKENFFTRVQDICKEKHKVIQFEDQDLLNFALVGRVQYLPIYYNMLCPIDEKKEECFLLHFASHPKPWSEYWTLNPQCILWTKQIYRDIEQYLFGTNISKSESIYNYFRWLVKRVIYRIMQGMQQYGSTYYLSHKM